MLALSQLILAGAHRVRATVVVAAAISMLTAAPVRADDKQDESGVAPLPAGMSTGSAPAEAAAEGGQDGGTATRPADGSDELALDEIAQSAAREAMNRETRVASGTALRLRDSPGVVTVFSRDEIRRLAPRDLLDLLHLVPGFSFGTDVQGFVGPIVRGLWGQEGKVLVLWDGFEMNETLYLSTPLENHFPLQAIERVEIIRGPGSALYGGYAELAVINIITRGASVNGLEIAATYGHTLSNFEGTGGDTPAAFSRANGDLLYGQRIQGGALDGLELSLNLFGGEAARSNRQYDDGNGSRYIMDWSNARQGPTWLSASARWGQLEVRTLLDLFRVAQRDHYGESLKKPINNSFYSAHLDVRYTVRLGDLVEIEPRLTIKRQLPWYSGGVFLDIPKEGEVAEDDFYYKVADRVRLTLVSRWSLWDGSVLTAGFEGYGDHATTIPYPYNSDPDEDDGSQDELAGIAFGNLAAFAELSFKSPIVNLTAGARFEAHSAAGMSFVPRVALTRSFGKLWFKALLSGAFKPPGIENLAANEEILPERSTVYEAELGYALTETVTLSATAFRVEIDRPIVFFSPEPGVDSYTNGARTGAQGAEVELHMLEEWGGLDASYSVTSSAGLNAVEDFESGIRGVLRAVPAQKLALAGRFNVTNNASIGGTLVVLSERVGWLGAADKPVEVEPAQALASVNVTVRDVVVDGLDASLAVHNLLDVRYRYLQPYDGGHAPLPAPGREVMGRVVYRFGL